MNAKRARAAVVGLGHSKVYRRADVPLGALAIDAARAAIRDAGLTPSDIDGLSTPPAQPFDGAGDVDGIHHVTTSFLVKALGLTPTWSDQAHVMVTQAFIQAANAVGAGACDYALVVRAMHNPAGRYGRVDRPAASGPSQFVAPYGSNGTTNIALLQRRYMEKYGATREQLGTFIVRNRENAMNWEYGYWRNERPEKLTLAEYMDARPISEPMCLYDCDLPVQGAAAWVLTSADRAADVTSRPAYILGTAISPVFFHGVPIPPTLEEYMAIGRVTATNLCKNAGIGPEEIDLVNLYDGFSPVTPFWVESLGLCGEGESFAWVADPAIPLNTSSGNLGAGRMHGVPHLMDGALQVMGRSGARQVNDARIAVSIVAPALIGAGVVFSREPTKD